MGGKAPTEEQLDEARQLAEQDAGATHRRVRYAELLRLAGRLDEAADAYRVAARAYTVQRDWYRAFAIARSLLYLDPSDADTQRYINAEYSQHRSGATTKLEPRDRSLISSVIEAPLPPALSAKPRFPLETSRAHELIGLDVLSDVTRDDVVEMLHHLRTVLAQRGETIFREGEMSDGMFIILRGEVSVRVVDDVGQLATLATLREGQFFGEFALLGSPLRTARVEAATRVELLDVDSEVYELLTERSARFRDAIHHTWSLRERQNVVARVSLLSGLPEEGRARIIEGLVRAPIRARELVVRCGDPTDRICIVGRGALEVYDRDEDGQKRLLRHLTAGRVVVDDAVADDQPYRLHARASEPCIIYWLSRELLLEVAGDATDGAAAFERFFRATDTPER
jgi:CRP-like cAMP-binding protein